MNKSIIQNYIVQCNIAELILNQINFLTISHQKPIKNCHFIDVYLSFKLMLMHMC